ncbi:MAG: toll/interleukin-1 receptor domain-containing protein [Pseudomonadota bacterium]
MAKIFFSYSHDDEAYRDQLEKHLAMLRHQGLIESWHDRRITAGSQLDAAIDAQLESADIVLLLVSSSFLASDYCYSIEMKRAMQRHASGDAVVVPVIVRPCDWHAAPFGGLLAAPKDGKAITQWPNFDEAYADVARQIRLLVESRAGALPRPSPVPAGRIDASRIDSLPRSSNLRLKKEFTDRDRDAFLHDTFEYLARFFEGSLRELNARQPGIESRFRRIDGDHFTATIFRNGKKVSECAIALGGLGSRDGAITYSHDASVRGNSFNEMLSIDADDQALHLKPLGMAMRSERDAKLSPEGAAEFFWSLLIAPLQ